MGGGGGWGPVPYCMQCSPVALRRHVHVAGGLTGHEHSQATVPLLHPPYHSRHLPDTFPTHSLAHTLTHSLAHTLTPLTPTP